MAMITCPCCGKQVSDKAKKCVNCGAILIPEEKKKCPECGRELDEGVTVCPTCGCPIENTNSQDVREAQKVEVTGVKVTQKTKSIIYKIAIAVVALIVIGFGVKQYQTKKAEEAYAQMAQSYSETLKQATYTMLQGASEAEDCGNLIKKVWYNSIYEERDSETDAYTRPKGFFVSDFNEALKNLFADSDFQSKISSIKSNQDSVESMMKKLKNPPDEYKEAYDAISKFYSAYVTLTGYAIDPTGSLQTFSSNFNDADTEALNCYNAMKLYLDD